MCIFNRSTGSWGSIHAAPPRAMLLSITSSANTLDDTIDSHCRQTRKIACLEDAFPFLLLYTYGWESPDPMQKCRSLHRFSCACLISSCSNKRLLFCMLDPTIVHVIDCMRKERIHERTNHTASRSNRGPVCAERPRANDQ